VTALECVADRLPGALVLVHSDAGRSAYASIWRERHFRWSLRLDDGLTAVRSDGQVVMVESPPKQVPEGDRTGVLLAGLSRLIGENLQVTAADRFVVPDVLSALAADRELVGVGREELVGASRERLVAGK
jgi:hypothetical protein